MTGLPEVSPQVNGALAVLVLLFFVGAGSYFVRLGLKTIQSRSFRNQRTGEMIEGRPALLLGYFLVALGSAGSLVIIAAFILSAGQGFRVSSR